MANEKVVLPKRVAETIEYLREERGVSYHSIYLIATRVIDIHSDEAIHLRKYVNIGSRKTKYLELMDALANGWEVEQTPEDKLRELYGNLVHKEFEDSRSWGARKGIEKTLEILGITIEGINDR